MRITKTLLTIFLFSFYFNSISVGQNSSSGYDLLLKFGNTNLTENLHEFVSGNTSESIYKGRFFKYIQFYKIPSSAERLTLEAFGLQFLDYIPNNVYLVEIPEALDRSVLKDFKVRSVENIRNEYKLNGDILDKTYPEWSLRTGGYIEVIVTYFNSLEFEAFESDLDKYDIHSVVKDQIQKTEILQIKIEDLEELASEPFVYFIEPVYPPGEPENYSGKTLHHSNLLDSEYSTGRHFDGTGINVMLQDDGIIGPHIDYDSRIGEQYLSYNSGDHGDHIAGTIMGAGNLDPTTKGMAPGAEIYVYSASGYAGFDLIPSHYNNPGIRISSTSYSNGCNAGYTTLTRIMDSHIRNYPALMHVFSAGNSGTSNCGYGAGAGWGNVTGGHKVGKNVIAVANLDFKDALSNSSSRGPAHDGRIKPDIAAKGSSVYSTTDPNSYTSKSGTSMSCPGVSGSLAQLYHAFKELNNQQEPTGGLMKAVILNTAEDLGNPGPDFKFGWGRINNLRAVKTLEEYRYLEDDIEQGELNTHIIDVPANTKELRVMVYWTDREASVGTTKALVNDLDITLEDPLNNTCLPWVLNHFPHPDSLNKPAIQGVDHLNNVEQVTIENPQPGPHYLDVSGFLVAFGPQTYYVIYDYIGEDITVTFPVGGEAFKPQESVVIRWDTYGDDGSFLLEYSPDNGQSWTDINTNVTGSRRYYSWNTPQNITGSGLIRVTRNSITGQSIEPFSIMHIPISLGVDHSCPNSVQVSWDEVPDAEYYEVFLLGDHYMESAGTTTADSIVVGNVSAEEVDWLSVRAVGPDNAFGRRSIAIEKDAGVWNCVFNTDVALSGLISPPSGILYDCQDYNNLVVTVEISNKGLTPATNIPVSFIFNNGNTVNESYNGTIDPGQSVEYEFSSQINLASGLEYTMLTWVNYQGDENVFNDTTESVIQVKTGQYYTPEVTETFDDLIYCGYAPDCGDIFCNLDDRWYNLENYVDDQIDWRPLNGITPTQGTGPIGDHTTGTIEGKFLYLEASGECFNREAVLMSPCIDLAGYSSPTLSLWYNMNGADIGSLHIDVLHDGKLTKNVTDPLYGEQGSDWLEKLVDLSGYSGSVINIRVRAKTGWGELSDIAIDDFKVTDITGFGDETGLEDKKYSIVPNPTSGIINLYLKENSTAMLQVTITDLYGKTIEVIRLDNTSKEYRLSLNGLKSGIYF
ncbi:MAG: S8 family serine peptidase, partial [Bacteroidales bacterium]|nr:S8 family serine peptidase [Bacteroidales bacterium]